MKNKALFLDRDGVINIDNGYVYKKNEYEFIDGVFKFVKTFYDIGYKIIIVTNQSGIGRGYFTEADFEDIMKFVKETFSKNNIKIDKVYHCPHHPKEGIGLYKKNCNFRKPNPGMILDAIDRFNIDASNSILVGDSLSDINAGISSKIGKNFLLNFTNSNVKKKHLEIDETKEGVFLCNSFKDIYNQLNMLNNFNDD
jgi:D-glycero-D-manno-heptose 1,7-bisphosphate phosphatase